MSSVTRVADVVGIEWIADTPRVVQCVDRCWPSFDAKHGRDKLDTIDKTLLYPGYTFNPRLPGEISREFIGLTPPRLPLFLSAEAGAGHRRQGLLPTFPWVGTINCCRAVLPYEGVSPLYYYGGP